MSQCFLSGSCQHKNIESTFLLSLNLVLLSLTALANSNTVTISESWANLEAGTNAEFHAVIQTATATSGNLQIAVTVGPQHIAVPIRFTVTPLKDNVAVSAILTVSFQSQNTSQNKVISSFEKTLCFFYFQSICQPRGISERQNTTSNIASYVS